MSAPTLAEVQAWARQFEEELLPRPYLALKACEMAEVIETLVALKSTQIDLMLAGKHPEMASPEAHAALTALRELIGGDDE